MDSSKDPKTKDVLSNKDENTKRNENVAEEQKNDTSREASSPGKIFIGGLLRSTTTETLTKHFRKYGEISDSVIMKDRVTGQSRGFGFVTFADPSVVDKVIQDNHILDGRTVEIKRTIPKGITSKIFVGGIPKSITDDEFKDYFSKFGKVIEHQIMRDRSNGQSRGFGFITFDNEQVVEEIISEQIVEQIISQGKKIELGGKQVEIKIAEPKKSSAGAAPIYGIVSRPPYVPGGVGGFTHSYNGFGGSGYESNSYMSAGGYGGRPELHAAGIISQGKMIDVGGKQVEIKKAEPQKPLPNADPIYGIDSRPPNVPGGVGGFRDSYSGFGGSGYGSNPYMPAGGYGGRPGGYAEYGGSEYGKGYGAYGIGSLQGSKEDLSHGYGVRPASYGEGFGGYGSGMIGGYGAAGYGYGFNVDGYNSNSSRIGGAYGKDGAYGSGTEGSGSRTNGRYHPYARQNN